MIWGGNQAWLAGVPVERTCGLGWAQINTSPDGTWVRGQGRASEAVSLTQEGQIKGRKGAGLQWARQTTPGAQETQRLNTAGPFPGRQSAKAEGLQSKWSQAVVSPCLKNVHILTCNIHCFYMNLCLSPPLGWEYFTVLFPDAQCGEQCLTHNIPK